MSVVQIILGRDEARKEYSSRVSYAQFCVFWYLCAGEWAASGGHRDDGMYVRLVTVEGFLLRQFS